MQCPQCGVTVASDAAFCQKCGAKVQAGEAPKVAPAAAAPAPLATGGGLRGARVDVPEETLWEGRYSPKAMLPAWFIAVVVTLALLVGGYLAIEQEPRYWWAIVGVIALVWTFGIAQLLGARLFIHYKLTNQRLFHQRGVLRQVTDRIEVIDIDDLGYEQNFFDRFTGVGSIRVYAPKDKTDTVLWLHGIDNVQDVFSKIDKARRAERMRRGLTIEQV
jgi:uncharacterized membrane protein YdbT with pleckstrin-like domain